MNSSDETPRSALPDDIRASIASALKSGGAQSSRAEEVWKHLHAAGHDSSSIAQLSAAELADVCLAFACARHDAGAVAYFVTSYATALREAVARIMRNGHDIDECVQAVRVKLLVGGEDNVPRIASYLGRGSLRGWVQVVAVRHAISMKRRGANRTETEADESLAEMLSTGDSELDALRAKYVDEFRTAFRSGIENLSSDDRRVLREHILEGMTIDDMAKTHGVSRATTARWVVSAREELGKLVRKDLSSKLKLNQHEFESIARLVRSQLDISYSALARSRT